MIMEHQDTTVDEATTLIENLRLDVVTMEQNQSSQSPKRQQPKTKFFADLLIELQIMIWEYTFPERRLIQFSLPLRVLRYGDYGNCEGDPPLPTALHVCHLSRETILTHYRMVYEHHLPYFQDYSSVGGKRTFSLFPVPHHRPICFNPKVDQFCMDARELHDYRSSTELQRVITEFPGCLDDIQVLEIRNVNWLLRVNPSAQLDGANNMRQYVRFEYGALNLFRKLKELHLVSSVEQDPCGSRQGLMATRSAHTDFMKWYEATRDLDPDGSKRSVPEVSFHCYRQKRAMSDEQRRNWKKLRVTESDGPRLSH
ncbi:hypothetical protein DL98DRAFT_536300 [Cadophora sp. DSE1049]|nr:hypothetical protein DL98DRAFT_536300 [Cadophora sp. DSE1049]